MKQDNDTELDRVKRRGTGRPVKPAAFDDDVHRQDPTPPVKPKKRLVIDGVIFQLQARRPLGISRVWQNLIPQLVKLYPHHVIILLRRRGSPPGIENLPQHEIVPYILASDDQLEADADMLGQICRQLRADVFLSTYFTRANGVRNVLMVHDLIPEIMGLDLGRPEWRAKTRAIVNADAFITVSHSTRNDLIRVYPDSKTRGIIVAQNGISPFFRPGTGTEIEKFKVAHDIGRPYFLLVGNRGQYKNCLPFFEAFTTLEDHSSLQIIAVGGSDGLLPHETKFDEKINIKFLPRLSDDELRTAYGGALSLVYLSRYEGFGLPVLEAMACGCPVITSRTSALPEVGGDAVLYADPDSPEEIAALLKAVLDLGFRKHLAQKGLQRARNFNWQRAARKIGNFIFDEKLASGPYLVSAIVSTYNAQRFIRGCIEDLEDQTIADRLEIIVIDSCSQQNEGTVVAELQQQYGNIKYIRTEKREGLYAAWNRGIKIASGKFITNANTDDRHRTDAFERMVKVLEMRYDVALVYADVIKTETGNQTFESCTPVGTYRWYDWDRSILLEEGCFIGPQPMWRRSVHDIYGYFDKEFVTSGDYEFWLRISQTLNFHHIREPLGLYLIRPDSIEHREAKRKLAEDEKIHSLYRDAEQKGEIIRLRQNTDNEQQSSKLNMTIQPKNFSGGNAMKSYEKIYQSIQPLLDGSNPENAIAALGNLVNSFPDFAQAHNDLGVLYYQSGEKEKALKYYEQAAQQEPGNVTFKKNLADFYYVEQGRVEDALKIYVDLLTINPEDIETLQITGHICLALHKFEDAKVFYNRVLEIEPWNAEAQEFLNKLKDRGQESIEEKAPDEIYQEIQSEMEGNDPQKVIEALEKLSAAYPDFALAHNDLGVLYYQSGQKEKSIGHYEQAAQLEPGNSIFQKNLADFYFVEQGRVEDALKIYVDVLTAYPEDIETLLITGHICVSLEKFDDARVFYHRILELEPWNADAKQNLDKLDGFREAVIPAPEGGQQAALQQTAKDIL